MNARWIEHTNKLIQTGYSIFNHVNKMPVSDKGASDEKIISLALLCRTISNFKGAILLVQNQRIVESRLLVRACFENLFYVAAIREKGYEFIKRMVGDDLTHRKSRGESLLAVSKKNTLQSEKDWEAPLREFLKETKNKQFQSSASLNPKTISKDGVAANAYIFYEQLSSDSAHPTTDALGRYFSSSEENGEIVRCFDIDPPVTNESVIQTLHLACNAMLGTLVGVNEILGGTSANDDVKLVFDAHQKIANTTIL